VKDELFIRWAENKSRRKVAAAAMIAHV